MFPQIGWPEITWRLFLTLLAGAVIGLNRGEHGQTAGLRTTMLVCLAASLSMIQVNLLLDMSGKSPSSFVVMDLMRLPLGILSGMGFIGAGAILRKDNLITGVTTAATLWFVTVVGLCLGGGQLFLGTVAVLLGFCILSALKAVERSWHHDRRGTLTVVSKASELDCIEIARQIEALGGRIVRWSKLHYNVEDGLREHACEVTWKACSADSLAPPFLEPLLKNRHALQVGWKI